MQSTEEGFDGGFAHRLELGRGRGHNIEGVRRAEGGCAGGRDDMKGCERTWAWALGDSH